MSHWQRHTAGGRFLEPKTLHPNHLRVIAARRKIQAAKRVCGPWRAVARWLGNEHKAGSLCRLSGDPEFRPSIALIELIEAAIPPAARVVIDACPSCGGAHVLADCHGAPVAAVVGLAPGETVKRPGKARTRRTYLRPCLSLDPVVRLRQLEDLYAEAWQAVDAAELARTIAVWLAPDDPENYEPQEAPHA